MAETLLEDADAQAGNAALDPLCVMRDLHVALADIDPSGPAMASGSSALSRTVALIGPQTLRVISSGAMPV